MKLSLFCVFRRVLKAPGGGSSDIFGGSIPSTPRSTKNNMVSNIFGGNGDARNGNGKTHFFEDFVSFRHVWLLPFGKFTRILVLLSFVIFLGHFSACIRLFHIISLCVQYFQYFSSEFVFLYYYQVFQIIYSTQIPFLCIVDLIQSRSIHTISSNVPPNFIISVSKCINFTLFPFSLQFCVPIFELAGSPPMNIPWNGITSTTRYLRCWHMRKKMPNCCHAAFVIGTACRKGSAHRQGAYRFFFTGIQTH